MRPYNYKAGEKIIFADGLDDESKIRILTVTVGGSDTVKCGEEVYYAAFGFPAKVEAELRVIIQKRAALKKAYDDSMKLIFELKNAITRGER